MLLFPFCIAVYEIIGILNFDKNWVILICVFYIKGEVLYFKILLDMKEKNTIRKIIKVIFESINN